MYSLEQVKYHIKNAKYKWCEIIDSEGIKVLLVPNNDSEEHLQNVFADFMANSPSGVYSCNFKLTKTSNNDTQVSYKMKLQHETAQLQSTSSAHVQNVDIEAITSKIYKQVKAEHEAELKHLTMKEKETLLNKQLAELSTITGKIGFVVENLLEKIIEKITPSLIGGKTQLAGTTPQANMENIQPIELTQQEQHDLTIAIQKFLQVTDVATLTLFANKVYEKPAIIEQLKNFL